jgi:hypothetical protein
MPRASAADDPRRAADRARGSFADLPAAAARVVAVARLSLTEAARSRLIPGLLVLSLPAFAYMAQIDAPGEVYRVQSLRLGILSAVTWLAGFGAAFTAAFALHTDVATRRVHTLLSKPLSPAGLFVGRLLGLWALTAALIVVLGLVGAVTIAVATAGAPADATALRVPTPPDGLAHWGDTVREDGDPARERVLADAYNAGTTAEFARAPGPAGDALIELNLRLLDRPGRLPRGEETAILTVQPLPAADAAAPAPAPISRLIVLRDRVPIRVPLPIGADRPADWPADWAAQPFRVTLELANSPYRVLLGPDGLRLLGPPRSPWIGYATVLLGEWAKIVLIVSVIQLIGALMSPYSGLLAGLLAAFIAAGAGTLAETTVRAERSLIHALTVQERFPGTPLDAHQDLALALFGEPGTADSRWGVITTLSRVLPAFDRFPLGRDFIAGYVPTGGDLAGTLFAFLAFALAAGVIGAAAFSTREVA